MSAARTQALHYPFAEPPAAGQWHTVARGVHWLRLPLPFSLDHINLWLLDDGEGVAIVDTGLGDDATRQIWEKVLAELGKPITKILVTHFHPDHVGNAQWLSEATGAPVWMSTGEYLLSHAVLNQSSGYDAAAMVAHFRRHGLDEARCAKLLARGNVYARGVPTLPVQYRRMVAQDSVAIDGRPWQMIVGLGHSPEHIALYCAEAAVLISGDMLLPRITTNINVAATQPDEDSVSRFLDSIERFAPLPADTLVLPSHGLPFVGIQTRIAALRAHHEERDTVLLNALGEPQTAAELLSTLFKRELDSHQVMFAMGEAIAHLNQLFHRGLLRKQVSAQGLIRFMKSS